MAMPDPFADEADEAQNAPAATNTNAGPWEEKPVTNAPTVVPSADGKLVVTLKGGTGFDAPWIVIHAADAADALTQLEDKELGKLIERTKVVAGFFAGGNCGSAPAAPRQSGGGGQAQRGRPATAGSSPDGEKRFCEHGERVFKSGVSKAGKTWQAYDCPNRVCDREWKN